MGGSRDVLTMHVCGDKSSGRERDAACLRKGCVCMCVCWCVHGCAFVQWQVTTGTVSSRPIKAQGTLRQRKDKQRRHPGMFCGQPNKNKSLYAHGRIIIARRRCVAIIMPRGATNLLDTSAIPQETQIPTCTKFTPLFLHNYTPTTEGHVGSWFGFSNEIAAILMLSSPSNSHL